MKKNRLGANPLAEYLSSQNSADSQESTTSLVSKTEHMPKNVQELSKKERITIHLPIDLIDRVKNAVFWEPGLTLTAFAQDAFEKALHEREFNRGQPYPERKERLLKSGRPVV